MIVQGHTVTPEQEAAALAAMRAPFMAACVARVVAAAGVPSADYTANRVADRLIQRERKAGRIRLAPKPWRWEPVS